MLNGKAGKNIVKFLKYFVKYFMKYFKAKNFMKFYITSHDIMMTSWSVIVGITCERSATLTS